MALAAKYEETKGLAYYLEERYHEVKVRFIPFSINNKYKTFIDTLEFSFYLFIFLL